jgi:hypothetical protein
MKINDKVIVTKLYNESIKLDIQEIRNDKLNVLLINLI